MPPTIDELLPEDHPARIAAAFVDALSADDWAELGVTLEAQRMGVPAYHPRALLGVWLYGFMVGIRSSRKLEAACREQLPFVWLAGGGAPDHNTLWRFYQAHREGMRRLLGKTIAMAMELDLIDWALQAVDGTKIQGDASNRWTLDWEQLERIEARTVRKIRQIEENRRPDIADAPMWEDEYQALQTMLQKVRGAQDELRRSGQRFVSLVDADAHMMRRSGGGSLTGYNAQAVAVRAGDEESQLVMLAAEVSQSAVDNDELPRLVDAAAQHGGRAGMTVADAGYFKADALAQMRDRGMAIAMPEGRTFQDHPYHWRHFRYDTEGDSYICPEGETLVLRQSKYTRQTPAKLYGAEPETCRACRAFGTCTTSEEHGRTITISAESRVLEDHRSWMETERAREALRKRPALIEPVFGIIKEQMAGRRFLLRGFEAVQAEWSLLAVAFNLRALCKHWKQLVALLSMRQRFAPQGAH